MPSIKYTLGRDTRLRADDPVAERAWLGRAHELHYPLPNKPRRAGPGDYVYFAHGGWVKARARIRGVVRGMARRTYTRIIRPAAPYDLAISAPMELAKRPIRQAGFQGYRYLATAEEIRWDRAF